MTALLRFLAGFLLIVAVILAVSDATRVSEDPQGKALTMQQMWSTVSPTSLSNAQAAVQRYTHSAIWQWSVLKVLQLPAWTLFGFVGLVLAYLGRRRRRVNVYAN
jgi:hypothetical protein